MEKPENSDVQSLQNAAGDCVPSPNTRRRLLKLKAPKLHIKIPFLKRGPHSHDLERVCHSADVVSNSLPSESFMPSKMYDVELYHECVECDETPEGSPGDQPDSFTNISISEEREDEADSDKHQSDLDENEKDNDESKAKDALDDSKENCEDEKSAEEETTPSDKKCCLKPILKVTYHGRRRASTYPGPHDCLEASFKRCVRFSPDTIEPTPRDCKYREWIEKKCHNPKSSPKINVKHEKRKCQLNQMRKVNISDYMSKNYGSSFFSPIGSMGGDMLL